VSLGGSATIKAADASGNPFNITITGGLTNSGSLSKIGAGKLIVQGVGLHTGEINVNEGTFALEGSGSIPKTAKILVASGATFDVGPSFTLSSNQILSGLGVVTNTVTAAPTAIINPGSNTVAGTLTLKNDLVEQGGAVNHFELSTNPTGPDNDMLDVVGALTASGTNKIEIIGTLPGGNIYKLIQYGSFSGGITNFELSGAVGALSNSATAQAIYLVVETSTRGPTNIVWVGNATTNDWDTGTNWLVGGTLDSFISGDFAQFDDTGAANPIVNIVGSVLPGSITVGSSANYTFTTSTGNGLIAGLGGLTKANTGTLTIQTTNTYTGTTTIEGGVLEVSQLANGGVASAIGSSVNDPNKLVVSNATLRYSGPNATIDRSITLAGDAGAVDISTANTLTIGGILTGSGGLTKAGTGNLILTGANTNAGVTTLSNGTLRVTGSATIGPSNIVFAGGTLSLAQTSVQEFYANTIDVRTIGTVIFNGDTSRNVLSGGWAGAGTLNVSVTNAACYCTLNGAMTTNFTGTIRLTDDSAGFFRFNSGGSASGAQQCLGTPTATFDLGNGTAIFINRNGGNTNYDLGALAGGSGTILRGSAGASSPNGYSIGAKNVDSTFAGTIENGSGGVGAIVSVIKVGAGRLTLSGINTYGGATIVSNGVLALTGSGSIANSTNIQVVGGAVLDVSGRSDGTLSLGSGQTLSGGGTVRGSVAAGSGSIVSPGDSPGILTVTNVLYLQSDSTLEMELDKTGNTNDSIHGMASVTYGGTLNLNITGSLALNDSFKLFDAAAYYGTFYSIVPAAPGPGLVWDTSTLTNGTLRVGLFVPVFGTAKITEATIVGTDLIVKGANGSAYAPFDVMTSTNVGLALNYWTPVATGFYYGDGTFDVTIPIDESDPQRYYIIKDQ